MPQLRRGRGRPSNHVSDPLITGAAWKAVRAHWMRVRGPCARCGRPIDYDRADRYWASLDVGHIVSRDRARALGWTDAQINAINNTQPEHQRCNRVAGVRDGNAKRTARVAAWTRPVEADDW